jgi:enediyne biosynthesis thioesterase
MRSYEYRHIVGFEETNLVGNVYYTNHVKWQGRCRELFLRDHAPDVLAALREDLCLVTTHCSCDYLEELSAFDVVSLRMQLEDLRQSRMTLTFEYWLQADGSERLVARGRQEVVCMRRGPGGMVPAPIPPSLRSALQLYGSS